MKRKVLSVIMMLSMVVGLTACGAKNPASITIEGNSYDLSGDFQEVVGAMAADGLQVANYYMNLNNTYVFDEDGKMYLDKDFDKEEPYLLALERYVNTVPQNDDLGPFIHKMYMLDTNAEFESKLGFNSESEAEELEELNGFIKCTPIRNMKSDAYVALYVDGKRINLREYEESVEEWKDEFDGKRTFKEVTDEFIPDFYYPQTVCRLFVFDFVAFSRDFDELEERVKKNGISLEEEMMLAFAMQEACEQLEEGEAESVVVVKVEVTEDDDVLMEYNEFYFDDDWDPNKFQK